MKWSDFFKKLGLNLDDEMEDTSKESSELDSKVNKNQSENSDNNSVSNETNTEAEKKATEDSKPMELKYDEKTGLFDLSGIEDESVKSVLKKANDTVKKTANQVKIDKAVEAKLAGLKLNKGITTDAVRKLADLSGVKVDSDGNVTGVNEAFDSLAKEQSGLFIADKETKETNSNPLLEGFNPQGSTQQGVVANSFTEAFAMME